MKTKSHNISSTKSTTVLLAKNKKKRASDAKVAFGIDKRTKNKTLNNLPSVALGDLAEDNMLTYGTYTIMSRAIPMLYDGLKPVHRRVMYSMDKLGLLNSVAHRKSAKVAGDTMGNYHPHGDMAIYGAMVGISTGNGSTPNALIDGQGNWGDFDGTGPAKGAASSRYTECRMTKLATEQLVNRRYMDPNKKAVIPYVPNYDGTLEEPLYLPALIPMLFLLGAEGIATGVTVNMPAYTYDSVIAATKSLLKTGKGRIASKRLVPVQRWGGKCLATQDELDAYHESGIAAFAWQAPYEVIRGKGPTVLRMTGLPPITYKTLYDGVLKIKGVGSFLNLSSDENGLLFEITIKDEACLAAVKKKLVVNENYKSAATLLVKSDDADSPLKVAFETWAPNVILEKWLEWRLELERRVIKAMIRDNDEEIRRLNLSVRAASKLDLIVEVLKAKGGDKVAMLEKKLKVSNAEAKEIWQMAVRQLDKLNADDTRSRLKRLEADNKVLKAEYKAPADRILKQLEAEHKTVTKKVANKVGKPAK